VQRRAQQVIGKRSACALANTTRLPLPLAEKGTTKDSQWGTTTRRITPLQKPLYATALHMAPRGVAEASLTYLTAHHRARHRRGCGETALPWFTGKLSWVIFRPLLRAYCARDGEGLRAQQGRNKAAFIERHAPPSDLLASHCASGSRGVTSFPASGRAPGTHPSPAGDLRIQRLDTF
jgi:hypothetical protein